MHQDIELLDIVAFLRVGEMGSFARAAGRLGVDKSIVSRRIARLERALGARLLMRGPSGASMTEVGTIYFAQVSQGMHQIEAAREAVASATAIIAGPLRVTAPVSFGVQHLASAAAEFAMLHPRVEMDISFDDRSVNLHDGHFDLAIRIGNLPDSTLIAKRLARLRMAVLASPDYLNTAGRPIHPMDIERHDVLLYANVGATEQWHFKLAEGWAKVRGKPRLHADNGEMLREAAIAGLGIVVLPTFIASPAIADGQLEVLLRDYPLVDNAVHAVMPPGRAVIARVRALVSFLEGKFGDQPAWERG